VMVDFVTCVSASFGYLPTECAKVFNKSRIEGFSLWVCLPKDNELFQLSPVSKIIEVSCSPNVEISSESIFKEGGLIRIDAEAVDLTVGLHTFQIVLNNVYTNDDIICTFQYVIQDDNPDRPYIYMNRSSHSADDADQDTDDDPITDGDEDNVIDKDDEEEKEDEEDQDDKV